MKKYCTNKELAVFMFLFLTLLTSTTTYAGTDLNQRIDTLAKKLASAAQGDVLKGSDTQVYISLGQLQGILPGNKFEIVRQGEPLMVGDEIMGYEETKIAEVEVERARNKVSICKVLEKTDVPKTGDKAYQLRKKINTLVIGQFSYNRGFNRLTKSLQEKLVTAMANLGMKVVERDQLERVLKEQKLGYSGLVNINSAKKIGELLGAEGMLLGTIGDMGDTITINGRMVDIETGKTVSAAEVELPKTPLIAQLLNIPVQVANESYTPQPTPSSRSATNKAASQVKDVDDFTFTLQQCKKSGQNVTCRLFITNNAEDREIQLSNKSRMFDNLGNAYQASTVQLANCDNKYSCRAVLISGIPTKASIDFKAVSSKAGLAKVVEMKCRKGREKFNVQFRDVALTK